MPSVQALPVVVTNSAPLAANVAPPQSAQPKGPSISADLPFVPAPYTVTVPAVAVTQVPGPEPTITELQ